MKCMSNIFVSLGISYLFKPHDLPIRRRKELLTVLDILKHAYGLSFFADTFQSFLGKVNSLVLAHQANLETFGELLNQYHGELLSN
jgi:hypothetical protein